MEFGNTDGSIEQLEERIGDSPIDMTDPQVKKFSNFEFSTNKIPPLFAKSIKECDSCKKSVK